MSFGRGVLWCNLGRPVKLGPVDGRVLVFILLALFHWAYWTFALAGLAIVFMILLQRGGYTVPNLYRRARVMIMGRSHPALTTRRPRSDV
jgi:hypothetical protein